jgi:hypothetical protein
MFTYEYIHMGRNNRNLVTIEKQICGDTIFFYPFSQVPLLQASSLSPLETPVEVQASFLDGLVPSHF